MKTLKEARTNAGLTQTQFALKFASFPNLISNYEAGFSLPDLEKAMEMEKEMGAKIAWAECLTPYRKRMTIQALVELCEAYPLPMIVEFASRYYRRNTAPDSMIIHYASLIRNEQEPLI